VILNTLIVILFIVIASIDIYAIKKGKIKIRYFTKPLLIPFLLFYYYLSAANINPSIIAALTFCFLGDFFLLFTGNHGFLLAGLVSFFSGHIFYAIVFLNTTCFLTDVPLWFYFSLIPYIFFGKFMYNKLNPYIQSLRIPVLVYLIAILFMGFSCFTRIWGIQGYAFWLPFAGSLAFIVSDTLLAIRTFKYKINHGWISIMILYLSAQTLIISGLLNS